MQLFNKHIGYFVLYGIVVFFIYIVVFLAVMILGFFTCCIGFMFLLIPYIGSVILLPVSVMFRAFSLEFLQQFGETFKIFPDDKQGLETVNE